MLVSLRQGEEPAGAFPRFVLNISIEPVTDDLHEADLAACPIEFDRDPLGRSREVDDGDLHDGRA